MIKLFYIEVASEEAGNTLAEHLEKHNGLRFVTENLPPEWATLYQILDWPDPERENPMRAYGLLTPTEKRAE